MTIDEPARDGWLVGGTPRVVTANHGGLFLRPLTGEG